MVRRKIKIFISIGVLSVHRCTNGTIWSTNIEEGKTFILIELSIFLQFLLLRFHSPAILLCLQGQLKWRKLEKIM